ncbi:hypothetical protein [Amphritea sp.]|uniref:hypothetical protein n=1 Tax=Amphritea sp. TaxID=1872502 RepID=UPI0035654960
MTDKKSHDQYDWKRELRGIACFHNTIRNHMSRVIKRLPIFGRNNCALYRGQSKPSNEQRIQYEV